MQLYPAAFNAALNKHWMQTNQKKQKRQQTGNNPQYSITKVDCKEDNYSKVNIQNEPGIQDDKTIQEQMTDDELTDENGHGNIL